jgi:hypothetical protein
VDDKILATKFDKFTEELKNIAKILKVANGFKISSADPEFKGGPIKGDEKKRAENVAKITAKEIAAAMGVTFNSLIKSLSGSSKPLAIKGVTNIGIAKSISKTLGWDAFKDRYEEWNASSIRKLVSIRDYMAKLVGLTQESADSKSKKKKEEGGKGIGSILGGIAGLALLGVGIFLIVQALVESAKVNPIEVVKVLLVVGSFVALFLLVGMAGSRLKNAALGFAILSATILFLVIPTLKVLGSMDWTLLLNSVLKFGVIALACIVILKLLSMVSPSNVIKSLGGLALFVLTIGFVIIPLLNVLNDVNWDKIKDGLLKFGVISLVCIGILKLMSMMSGDDVLKSVAGLALLSLTIAFVILPLLNTLVNTKFEEIIEGLFKFGVIALVCIGLMKLMSMIPASDVLKSVGGILLFTLVIGFVVLPVLKTVSQEPFEQMLKALGFLGLIMVGIGLIIRLTGEILTRGGGMVAAIAGLVAVLAISFLMGYLADQLNKFASLDWSAIGPSLALALVALGIFGAAVIGIGALVLNPIVAPLLIAGAVAVAGLSLLMGLIAEALNKFSTVNADQIQKVGIGLLALGPGLVAFLAGMVGGVGAGVVSKLSGIFGLNPADQIKKFEQIDADKIHKLGSGLLFMGQGLKALSSDINLEGITNQIIKMTAPLVSFSNGLVSFTEAYKNLDTAIKGSEINRIYQMKLEADTGIQKALVDLNQKEVEILSAQLDELKRNGEYLKIIASSSGTKGGGIALSENNFDKSSASISNFSTKNSYMNHLKLTTSSLES